jgi:MFS family permease
MLPSSTSNDSAVSRERQRGQLLLSIGIRFLIYTVHWMVLALLPLLLKQAGFSDLAIGTAIGVFAVSSMFLMLPMGTFSDIFSPKRTIMCGALLYGLYFALLPAISSFLPLLLNMVLGGIGSACLIVVSEGLYLKQFGQMQRGRRISFFQLATYLGFGAGPLIGGLVMQRSIASLYAVAVCGALLILVAAFFLHDYEPITFNFTAYRGDIMKPRPLLLLACIFVLGSHFGTEQTSLSLLMETRLGFSPQTIGLVFAGLGLWMAIAVPFIGRWHDRRNSQFLFLLCGLLLSGFFQALTSQADSFTGLLAIRSMHTLGDAFALLELSVLTAALFPAQRLGGTSGLLYAVRTMATFFAALLSGLVNRSWGYHASFGLNGLFVMLFALASIAYILTHRQKRDSIGWHRGALQKEGSGRNGG